MRQMACHVCDADPRQERYNHYSVPVQPDLVLKSRRNVDLSGEIVEAAICRICHDIAEDAIKSTCRHLFDRACMQQYIEACGQDKVRLSLVWDDGSIVDYITPKFTAGLPCLSPGSLNRPGSPSNRAGRRGHE